MSMVTGAGNCDWAGIRFLLFFVAAGPGPASAIPQIIQRTTYGDRGIRAILVGNGVISRNAGAQVKGA